MNHAEPTRKFLGPADTYMCYTRLTNGIETRVGICVLSPISLAALDLGPCGGLYEYLLLR